MRWLRQLLLDHLIGEGKDAIRARGAATEVAGECALPRMLRPFSQGARPNDTAASQSSVTCRLMQINQRLDRAGHTSVGT